MCSGICVLSARTDPPNPQQKQDISFYVTFGNFTGSEQKYRWFVQIYDFDPDRKDPKIGQTAQDDYILPTGTTEFRSLGTWRIGPGRPCYTYTGKVQWLPGDGSLQTLLDAVGNDFSFPINVCP